MGQQHSAFHPGQEHLTPTKAVYICADQPVTSLFACGKAADHTFRVADRSGASWALYSRARLFLLGMLMEMFSNRVRDLTDRRNHLRSKALRLRDAGSG